MNILRFIAINILTTSGQGILKEIKFEIIFMPLHSKRNPMDKFIPLQFHSVSDQVSHNLRRNIKSINKTTKILKSNILLLLSPLLSSVDMLL